MKQFLVEFKHDSKHLGYDGLGILLISANTFKQAIDKVKEYGLPMINEANGFKWNEGYTNARDFRNLTVL